MVGPSPRPRARALPGTGDAGLVVKLYGSEVNSPLVRGPRPVPRLEGACLTSTRAPGHMRFY